MKKKEKDAKPVVLPGEKFKHMKMQKQKEATSKVEGDSDLNVEVNDPMIIAPDEDEEEEEDIKVIFDDEGNEIPLESKKILQSPIDLSKRSLLQRKRNYKERKTWKHYVPSYKRKFQI